MLSLRLSGTTISVSAGSVPEINLLGHPEFSTVIFRRSMPPRVGILAQVRAGGFTSSSSSSSSNNPPFGPTAEARYSDRTEFQICHKLPTRAVSTSSRVWSLPESPKAATKRGQRRGNPYRGGNVPGEGWIDPRAGANEGSLLRPGRGAVTCRR